MAYEAFNEILSIKAFRETRAELTMLKQRSVFQMAGKMRDESEQALSAFRDYALNHERAIYADLCRHIVRLREIEDVQQEVVILRGTERGHEQTLQNAEQALATERKRLDEVREEHTQASRMKQKFVELVNVYSEEQRMEFERKEDAELEEVAKLRRDRADWDEYHEEEA